MYAIRSYYGGFWGCTVAFGVRNLSRTLEGLKEIHARLGFMKNVGLDYLTLERKSSTSSYNFV